MTTPAAVTGSVRPGSPGGFALLVRYVARAALVVSILCAIGAVLGIVYGAATFYGDGYRAIIVRGGSMGETLPNGSLAIAVWRDAGEIRAGDVIVVREASEDGSSASPVIHRVTEVEVTGDAIQVHTRGDANKTEDPQVYTLPDRVMVATHNVRYLGFVLGWVASPLGWLILVFLPITGLAASGVYRLWRPRGPPEGAPA